MPSLNDLKASVPGAWRFTRSWLVDLIDEIQATMMDTSSAQTLSNKSFNDITFIHGSTPSSPAAGRSKMFIDSATASIYTVNSAGTLLQRDSRGDACEGRLTLQSGTPVPTSDTTAATTLYFTPYKGSRIAIFNGTYWQWYSFTERSIAVPATTNTNYDVFIYDNAGTLTLELTAWASATARATLLAVQNGVLVKTGATSRRYLGTFRTTGVSGQTEDSRVKRFVWNYYNRVLRGFSKADATSHTYNAATLRQWNATSTNQVEYVCGYQEDWYQINLTANTTSLSAVQTTVGIGFDSTTAYNNGQSQAINLINSATNLMRFGTTGSTPCLLGYRTVVVLEAGNAATPPTFAAYSLEAAMPM